MTAPTWNLQPGETSIREHIHGQYGGNPQAGISRSSSTPNVLVYSDHDKGAANGYDFDGWDSRKQVFYYTGEGQSGNQVMMRGNRAVAEHEVDGHALRLFVAVGNQPGSGTRIHRYVGQFRVDPDLPYLLRTAPGSDGVPRQVFVFRLLPMGPVGDARGHTSTIAGAGEAASVTPVTVTAVPVQAINTESTEVEKVVSGPVIQKELQLADRFQRYLEGHDREVMRYRIIPLGSAPLYSDLADVTENVLYEAKGAADRMSVRLALGQVLDYGRFVKDSLLAVLLPGTPPGDLVELLESHDVGCIVETTPSEFLDMTNLGRCP